MTAPCIRLNRNLAGEMGLSFTDRSCFIVRNRQKGGTDSGEDQPVDKIDAFADLACGTGALLAPFYILYQFGLYLLS
jgi:hypothetical protein